MVKKIIRKDPSLEDYISIASKIRRLKGREGYKEKLQELEGLIESYFELCRNNGTDRLMLTADQNVDLYKLDQKKTEALTDLEYLRLLYYEEKLEWSANSEISEGRELYLKNRESVSNDDKNKISLETTVAGSQDNIEHMYDSIEYQLPQQDHKTLPVLVGTKQREPVVATMGDIIGGTERVIVSYQSSLSGITEQNERDTVALEFFKKGLKGLEDHSKLSIRGALHRVVYGFENELARLGFDDIQKSIDKGFALTKDRSKYKEIDIPVITSILENDIFEEPKPELLTLLSKRIGIDIERLEMACADKLYREINVNNQKLTSEKLEQSEVRRLLDRTFSILPKIINAHLFDSDAEAYLSELQSQLISINTINNEITECWEFLDAENYEVAKEDYSTILESLHTIDYDNLVPFLKQRYDELKQFCEENLELDSSNKAPEQASENEDNIEIEGISDSNLDKGLSPRANSRGFSGNREYQASRESGSDGEHSSGESEGFDLDNSDDDMDAGMKKTP